MWMVVSFQLLLKLTNLLLELLHLLLDRLDALVVVWVMVALFCISHEFLPSGFSHREMLAPGQGFFNAVFAVQMEEPRDVCSQSCGRICTNGKLCAADKDLVLAILANIRPRFT